MAATSAEVAAGVDRWWLQWIRSCSTWSLSVSRAHVLLKRGPKTMIFAAKWASYVGKKNELFSVADFLTKPHGPSTLILGCALIGWVCGVARAGSQLAAKLAAKAKFVRKPHSGRRAPQGSRNRGEYVARIILGSCWDLRLTIHRLNSWIVSSK